MRLVLVSIVVTNGCVTDDDNAGSDGVRTIGRVAPGGARIWAVLPSVRLPASDKALCSPRLRWEPVREGWLPPLTPLDSAGVSVATTSRLLALLLLSGCDNSGADDPTAGCCNLDL